MSPNSWKTGKELHKLYIKKRLLNNTWAGKSLKVAELECVILSNQLGRQELLRNMERILSGARTETDEAATAGDQWCFTSWESEK